MARQPFGFSASVLAGGLSSRMGRDKAALPFAGGTLLEYQVRKLRNLGIRDIMISGCGQDVPDARFVPDAFPHRGPLSGIHACLEAAAENAVLFLSVDTPLVPAGILQELMAAHIGGITLLRHGEQTEPLIGIYDRTLAPLCAEILQSERTGVWQLLNRVVFRPVPYAGDEDLFLNANTPEDYVRLLQILEGHGDP